MTRMRPVRTTSEPPTAFSNFSRDTQVTLHMYSPNAILQDNTAGAIASA
jgi:hypothetical protein